MKKVTFLSFKSECLVFKWRVSSEGFILPLDSISPQTTHSGLAIFSIITNENPWDKYFSLYFPNFPGSGTRSLVSLTCGNFFVGFSSARLVVDDGMLLEL